MAKKQVLKEEVETNEDTSAAATLKAGGGSASSGADDSGTGDVTPSNFSIISSVMGELANLDKESLLRFYQGMMETHFNGALGKNIPDGASEKNKATIHGSGKDGSNASGTGDVKPSGKSYTINPGSANEMIKQEVNDMLSEEEGLTPEFKEKAAVLFEAAINAKVALIQAEIEDQHSEILDEEIASVTEALEEKVSTYIEYVAEEWMKENEVAIESALRSEITTEFMSKLRDLFTECNVNIPEDQVEVVDALATKVDELESRLSDAIHENAQLRKVEEKATRKEIVDDAIEGMTLVDAEKLKKLAEGVESDDAEEFQGKVDILKESLTKTPKKSTVEALLEETDEDNKNLANSGDTYTDPSMRKYLEALDRTRS